MKRTRLIRTLEIVCTLLLCCSLTAFAQPAGGSGATQAAGGDAPMPSPPATANVTVGGGTITIHYNSPSMRGRKIMGALVPYGKVWRTGANPATTIVTSIPLKFGSLLVPAGTHTLFTLPSADVWQLIISKDVGEWGLDYKPAMDLGRTPMKAKPMTAPQEAMSLSFEHTTAKSTELHVRWETTDRYVLVTVP